MVTTIQISETTKQLLVMLKEKEHTDTYDELIRRLVHEHHPIPTSMFGSIPGWKWNKKTDRAKTHDEL